MNPKHSRKIPTGEEPATGGEATLGGFDIKTQQNLRQSVRRTLTLNPGTVMGCSWLPRPPCLPTRFQEMLSGVYPSGPSDSGLNVELEEWCVRHSLSHFSRSKQHVLLRSPATSVLWCWMAFCVLFSLDGRRDSSMFLLSCDFHLNFRFAVRPALGHPLWLRKC